MYVILLQCLNVILSQKMNSSHSIFGNVHDFLMVLCQMYVLNLQACGGCSLCEVYIS